MTAKQLPIQDIHTQEQFIDMINDDEVKAKFTQLASIPVFSCK
ncbi:hypothetical protein G0U57_018767 [Chelydra serpentina]|uniref:Uncharacterized protein n=1 Tax=Chelydra serpentina TaxID=8475 RepID=A0A8T1TG84_CHESE|nr:hypothetical protein G0U57_018767 [Chelydra serpentina]